MHHARKIPLANVNPHLTCSLCGGYFVDATTIIECLHSFCKSCIVRYLETNKFCPVCDVQIHKTRPLLHIRSDKTLQAVVYKLVPGLHQREMKLRREFYTKNPGKLPADPVDRGEEDSTFIYSSDEIICLSLEYADKVDDKEQAAGMETDDEGIPRRYLRCPAAVTVGLLKRLVRGKYGLDPNHALDILYSDSFLCDEYSLVDLAYMFDWKRKGPMRLKYRIYQDIDMPPSPSVNGNIEEKAQVKESTEDVKELPDAEKNGVTPPPEPIEQPEKQESILPADVKMEKGDEDRLKLEKPEETSIPKEAVASTNGTLKESPVDTCKTSSTSQSTVVASVADPEPSSQSAPIANGSSRDKNAKSEKDIVKHNKAISILRTLKLTPKLCKPTVNRIAAKRPANDAPTKNDSDASPAKKASTISSKTPRPIKARNDDEGAVASVTESPVQEVAVNLTKPASTPKKSINEKEKAKERQSPSPRTRTDSPSRPFSAPNPSQSAKASTDDATAKQKNPPHSVLPLVASNDDSAAQFRLPHPSWLNLARGTRPGQMLLSGFANRTPLPPAQFLSSLIAAQSSFPYLGMSLPNDGKKGASNQHKMMGPRALPGFPTPPFNAMQGYPPGLSAIFPMTREMLGSFYHPTYTQPRSFTPPPGRSSGTCPSPRSSPSAGSSSNPSSSSAKTAKSGQRPSAPRRVSAPPPALVPISPGSSIRSPPTLLPITDAADKEKDKDRAAPDASSSPPVTVVESSLGGSETQPAKEEKGPEKTEEAPVENGGSSNQSDSVEKNETSHAGSSPASSKTPAEAADS